MARKQQEAADDTRGDIRRKVKRTLKVILTEQEERQFGKDMARTRQQLEEIEDQFDEVKSQFKTKIESCEAEQNRLSRLINNGYEYRDVECEEVSDFDAGEVTIVRLDTGEQVEHRPMTASERQMEIPAA